MDIPTPEDMAEAFPDIYVVPKGMDPDDWLYC